MKNYVTNFIDIMLCDRTYHNDEVRIWIMHEIGPYEDLFTTVGIFYGMAMS